MLTPTLYLYKEGLQPGSVLMGLNRLSADILKQHISDFLMSSPSFCLDFVDCIKIILVCPST